MRNPAGILLFPIALLALAACGQSGPLVHPDKNAEPVRKVTTPVVTPVLSVPAGESDEEKKKKDEDADKPAAATSPDVGTSPTP